MTISGKILFPWVPEYSTYYLDFRATGQGNPPPVPIVVVPGREYWVSGDSNELTNEQDLLKIVSDSVTAWFAGGSLTGAFTAALDTATHKVAFSHTYGAVDVVLTLSSGLTTLPLHLLGISSLIGQVVTTGPAQLSQFQTSHVWRPERPAHRDSDDVPTPVAAYVHTAGGQGRGYVISEGVSRSLEFQLLARDKIIERYAKEYQEFTGLLMGGEWRAWRYYARHLASGSRIRWYPDETDISEYSAYRILLGDQPAQRDETAVRYDLRVQMESVADVFEDDTGIDCSPAALDLPQALTNSLFGDQTVPAAKLLNFTVSFWLRPNTLNLGVFFAWENSAGGAYRWAVFRTGVGALVFRRSKDGTATGQLTWTSGADLVAGVWEHWTLSFALSPGSDGFRAYRNGVDVTSGGTVGGSFPGSTLLALAYPMRVGNTSTLANAADAQYDNVAVWGSHAIRSTAAATELYNGGKVVDMRQLSQSPVPDAWWRFEGDWADSMENHHLTFVSGAASPDFVLGVPAP